MKIAVILIRFSRQMKPEEGVTCDCYKAAKYNTEEFLDSMLNEMFAQYRMAERLSSSVHGKFFVL